ncbi:hypothetical protein VPH35_037588 [Triticum aestivum]
MEVQVAPQEALPAPQEVAANVNALADAIEFIFQSITDVQDDEALNTIWIRSERPYRIEISLRMLQQTILLFGQIHPECFNLAVLSLSGHFLNIMCSTLTLLLVVNMESRMVLPIDPCVDTYDGPYNFHSTETRKEITILKQEFNDVLQMRIPGWDTNLMDWSPYGISSNGRRKDAAFLVLQEMAHQNGTTHSGRMTTHDSIQLRKNLMVQMLMIKNNEAAGNIPAEIRAALRVLND